MTAKKTLRRHANGLFKPQAITCKAEGETHLLSNCTGDRRMVRMENSRQINAMSARHGIHLSGVIYTHSVREYELKAA